MKLESPRVLRMYSRPARHDVASKHKADLYDTLALRSPPSYIVDPVCFAYPFDDAEARRQSHAFIKKTLDIGTQHPDMLSPSFLEEMRKDAQLFERLAPIRLAIDLLKKQLDDTVTQSARKRTLRLARSMQ